MRTVNFWLRDAPEGERYAQSRTMAQHDKAGSHERRFAYAMGDNFKYTSDLESFVEHIRSGIPILIDNIQARIQYTDPSI